MQSLSSFAGIIGNWKSSGEVLQPGVDPMLINGTDTYEWVLADFFILHRVNVMMGKEQVEVIELIGGEDENGIPMRSFTNKGEFETMYASVNGDGTFLFNGNNIRSILKIHSELKMTADWERKTGDLWIPWMKMEFAKIQSV